ncbi:SDR family NAD(P)-dependent oxidoreductase [Sandaracinobacteroides saxicola]|uniref:SDR family oxidoreductase n=1 Tax=Sandaracinobacteroides saxicola TaxID=2759707 RepID=A0A7G5IKZ4_9SPHN|nr:SDR family oxidoreductase [Sandaracinobacteroides saxicola]QMW24036.1 SDR family oxidoreductase [Sandaracinobacteroides saxicola]
MIDYSGQVALVTGGASGIGLALGRALCARGARVVLADIAPELDAVAAGMRAVHADLADPATAERLVADIYATEGRLDLIASNAGVGYRKRLLKADFSDPAIARLFEINSFAAFRFAQAWLPRLESAGQHGRLLITGSENSLSVPDAVRRFWLGLYAASKHSVLILAEWLREELEANGAPLTLHMLLPGGVYTGMTRDGLPADPAQWPPHMGIITPERCADIALAGIDADRFHIPTHPHLADDMRARAESVAQTLDLLALR